MNQDAAGIDAVLAALREQDTNAANFCVPVDHLIAALQSVEQVRPDSVVTVGALRYVLSDIRDNIIEEATA